METGRQDLRAVIREYLQDSPHTIRELCAYARCPADDLLPALQELWADGEVEFVAATGVWRMIHG